MKKFIIIIASLLCVVGILNYCYYYLGLYIDFNPDKKVETFIKTNGDYIYLDKGTGYEKFEIKGVDLGSGIPGKWSTDFGASKEDYLRWFKLIKEMGANTIRVYTINNDDFYNAFYEFNKNNPEPLYLLHGVWVNDYMANSHRDAYDNDIYDRLLEDCNSMVDVIHGKKKISLGHLVASGHGTYNKDISQWVLGYILGVEWEDVTVAYTNNKYKSNNSYNAYTGKYMYTSTDATPFEAMLASVGDSVIEYETKRYKQQRLVAFSNWSVTDPFVYPDYITDYYLKCATIDVEHIKTTDNFLSGQFASYHIYAYYRDYLAYVKDWNDLNFKVDLDSCYENGVLNTYKLYIKAITDHHKIPVVIAEFGVSTGRGIAQIDKNTGRNQGHLSESEQGQALVKCYYDIIDAGCAGSCIFSWQDEWFKRCWNTNYAIDFSRTPYWSDYQTNEQYFGLLAFDTGKEKSVAYVDGDVAEWEQDDIVSSNNGLNISMKYDEAFIYFMIEKKNFNFGKDVLYIPIDTTPKSGSNYCKNNGLKFNKDVDFLIEINGKNNSRIMVQERYESLRANYSQSVYGFNTYVKENIPDKNSPYFKDINLLLQLTQLQAGQKINEAQTFPTGTLTYGVANPNDKNFNSLADFYVSGNYIEIRLPWQLLNFSDPSEMKIHDDYYDGNYGVKYITIDSINVGVCEKDTKDRITLQKFNLKGWKNNISYHERLKESYYQMKEIWR